METKSDTRTPSNIDSTDSHQMNYKYKEKGMLGMGRLSENRSMYDGDGVDQCVSRMW